MAIAVKLDDLLHDRRMTLTELADRIGMTLANLSILKTGKARAIRFSTLEAICDALSCQPGDLLRFRVGGGTRATGSVPLSRREREGVMGALPRSLPHPPPVDPGRRPASRAGRARYLSGQPEEVTPVERDPLWRNGVRNENWDYSPGQGDTA